jgi:hypothetical protein
MAEPGSPVMGMGQMAVVMVLVSRVTDPLRARARPKSWTPVFTVIEVSARMVPWKVEPVPGVAELPTCQNTLQAWVPLMRFTTLDEAVVSAEPTWMMKTAFGSPCPSRVSVPVMPSVEVEL